MGLTNTSFKSRTPLQDRQAELGMDVIVQCDDTLKLNERLMELNSELDDLRGKRHIYIYNLHKITQRETEIDKLQDAAHKRINELESLKKADVKEINQITEETKGIIKRFEFTNCTVTIE